MAVHKTVRDGALTDPVTFGAAPRITLPGAPAVAPSRNIRLSKVPPDSERAAFLAKIAENPRCETTKKVYADWLDEHDEPKLAHLFRTWNASGVMFDGRFLTGSDEFYAIDADTVRDFDALMAGTIGSSVTYCDFHVPLNMGHWRAGPPYQFPPPRIRVRGQKAEYNRAAPNCSRGRGDSGQRGNARRGVMNRRTFFGRVVLSVAAAALPWRAAKAVGVKRHVKIWDRSFRPEDIPGLARELEYATSYSIVGCVFRLNEGQLIPMPVTLDVEWSHFVGCYITSGTACVEGFARREQALAHMRDDVQRNYGFRPKYEFI